MEVNYSSVPKVNKPFRTLVIITIITLGFGYLWYQHNKNLDDEE
jgi:hypothetical protein